MKAAGYGWFVEPRRLWSRRLADELWSGVVTPLTFSTLAGVMTEHMARRRLVAAGLGGASREPVFRLFRGHVYVNASLVADVMRELPAAVISDGLLELLPAELRGDIRAGARASLSPAVFSTIAHLTWNEREWMPWSRASAFAAESIRVERDLAPGVDPERLSATELGARYVFLQERLGDYLDVVSWGIIYAYVFFHLTSQLLGRWGSPGASMSTMLAGTLGIRTFEIHEQIRAAAEIARRDEGLRSAILSSDPSTIAARCRAGDLGDLGVRVREILDRHGHRLVGRDLGCPTWAERPDALVEMLRGLVSSPASPRGPSVSRESAARAELDRIGSGLGGTARRELFGLCLRWCRDYYAVRENMRYQADRFLAALRACALAAGRHLVDRGDLASVDDVFFLERDELLAATGGGDVAGIGERARARAREYESFRRESPPEIIEGDRAVVPEPVVALRERSLAGVGVSPGTASGVARVVLGAEDFESVAPGEVIVAQATDPSWTSVLSLGAGIVLEMGGLLSHGAIVARELGIPAVVDVPRATALIGNGDRVTVDGATGRIAVVAA